MTSSDISTISKKMESMFMTDRVIRHNKRLPQSRYSPYTNMANIISEKHKEEAIQFGVEFSLLVAEAMFLLSDDIRSTLRFCNWLLSFAGKNDFNGPMVGRVFNVIEYVFITYTKPKNGVYHAGGKPSPQWQLIGSFRQTFCFGMRGLACIVAILKSGSIVKSPACFELYNKEYLNKLEEKLRPVRDVSEANGFVREAIESNILHLWTSLFETTPTEAMNPKARLLEVFGPLVNEANQDTCCRLFDSLLI